MTEYTLLAPIVGEDIVNNNNNDNDNDNNISRYKNGYSKHSSVSIRWFKVAFVPKLLIDLNWCIHRNWSPLEWTSSDDRVRGGSSQSYIDASPLSPIAVFYGNLDTKTLGGAGFASQRTTTSSTWDLSNYDGILLDIEKTDGKKYTLILKDEILPKSPNGREQSTISWEYDFGTEELTKHGQGGEIFVPWEELVPTYRGREKKDVEPLNLKKVRRFSIMMRR